MKSLSLICLFLIAPLAIPAQEWQAEGVFLSNERLETLKQRIENQEEPTYSAYQQLKKIADSELNRKPHVPNHWYIPGYYRDAKGHTESKRVLQDDANSAYMLALYYRITEKVTYAKAAIRLIDAWAAGIESMSTKDDSTLSFSYHFPAMIFAADLLKEAPFWPSENQQRFKKFVKNRALPMNTMDRNNNWGNWGLVLVMASAAYLNDHDLFDAGIARWKEFIELQIADDGHMIHEVNRSDGLRGIWYSHFSLMPQTIAAEIAKVNGVDLYDYRSSGGHTLKKAFEKIAEWTLHPETFPYWDGEPDELRGVNYFSYFEILNTHWPKESAETLLKRDRPLTARHCTPVLTFTHGN